MNNNDLVPFLSPDKNTGETCLICCEQISIRQQSQSLNENGWDRFKWLAKKWNYIAIPEDSTWLNYSKVHEKVKDSKDPFGKVHKNCRINFRNKCDALEKKLGVRSESAIGIEHNEANEPEVAPVSHSRIQRGSLASKRLCYVCSLHREIDGNDYNEGGLGRCSHESAGSRILERTKAYLEDPTHKHHAAAERLQVLLSGHSYDIYSKDVYYHKSCYLAYAHHYSKVEREDHEVEIKKDVIEAFLLKIKTKIIRDKCAYLLNELLQDVESLSEEYYLKESVLGNTRSLKRTLVGAFGDSISFFPNGKYLLVHSSEMNPCEYSVATLHGYGLRDDDIARSFGKLIRRKVQGRKTATELPKDARTLDAMINTGPLAELYNAIVYSLYDQQPSKNSQGYATTTSNSKSIKVWSLASDWESLLTRQPSMKQIVLGLVSHRMSGSKHLIKMLHKLNHATSYSKIRKQNKAWSLTVTNRKSMLSNMRKGIVTHSTMDNNDGRQESVTGAGTTHDTNQTLFQVPTKHESENFPRMEDVDESPLDIGNADDATADVPYFNIGKLVEPPLFKKGLIENEPTSELEKCFKRDFAWSLTGSLTQNFVEGEVLPFIGSWTCFNKMVTEFDTAKCVQDYLPVYPHPPNYPICKKYLDFLCEVILDLEIPHIFSHSDEAVYSKLCHILWKNQELYKKVIILMGGFHQLRVLQKLLYKRHYCRGYKQWCVDANVIAGGSADQAFEGRHYYRSMRVHKECFDALMQLRIEEITKNHELMDVELRSATISLRRSPNASKLKHMLSLKGFNELFQSMQSVQSNSEGALTIAYLKDVSLILAMVSAVRKGDIEQHLQAEKGMLSLVFAFNHQNYARYCSYSHINLRSMEKEEHPSFRDLQERGFGASISGEPFSSIHGDLVTELFNKETKGAGGPFRGGFSTSIEAVNTWVNTIHIHSRLKQSFKKAILYNTSSKHKELTPGGRKLHHEHVEKLKAKLNDYGVNAFSTEKPKCFATGEEIEEKVVRDMLSAPTKGEELHLKFVNERLTSRQKSFFDPIKRNAINNGMEKKKRVPKATSILKEDRQAFGLLAEKAVNIRDALMYPLTSVPLAIANPDSSLKFSDKCELRNFLINKSDSKSTNVKRSCSWFIDGMAAVRSLKPKATYKEWMESLLRFITPPSSAEIKEIGLINDVYLEDSVKEGMRRARGETKEGARVKIEGFDQHMLQGNRWQQFLTWGEHKTELISMIARYASSKDCSIKHPFIFTAGNKTYKTVSGKVEMLFDCNHEEADSRLIPHALHCKNDVVVVCKDTDVLILLIWAYIKYNIKKKWYMKYEKEQYADIGLIAEFLDPAIGICLPTLHALTGCDTTSHFNNTSKCTILKKLISNPEKISLIQNIGKNPVLDAEDVNDVKEFIRTVFYSGKKKESYIDTRVRLYKTKKVKSSSNLPPDEDSLVQAIYRVHYQVYQWIRSNEINIRHLAFSQYGWRWSVEQGAVVPVWFVGNQLPPEFSSRKSKSIEQEGDADDETEKTVKRKERKRKLQTAAERQLHTKSQFMQMVDEERRRDEIEEIQRKIDSVSTNQIPRYEESIEKENEERIDKPIGEEKFEDADDEAEIKDAVDEEGAEDADDEIGIEGVYEEDGSHEQSAIEDEGEGDEYHEFFIQSGNSEMDNDDQSEWEVSDFLSSEESDDEWVH